MADKVIISGDLPTGLTVSRSPIRDAGSVYDCIFVLLNFPGFYHFGEEYYLR
jgi:hypothetical protein